MTAVNVHEAKTQLSKLLALVERGDVVTIARAGKPVAKLVAADAEPSAERLGFLTGYGRVPDDFDSMMGDEIAAMFEGDAG